MAELTENVLLAVLAEADLFAATLLDLHDELFKCLLEFLFSFLFSIRIYDICHLGAGFVDLLHLSVLGLVLLLHRLNKSLL
jgi:hypothetical protein